MSNFRTSRGYEDIQVFISTARVPAVNAPSWTTYAFGIGGGVTFPVLAFSVNEYIEFYIQTSHTMELNSILDNHIHWTVLNNYAKRKMRWRLDVIAAGVGATFAVPAGSPYVVEYTFTGAEAARHNLLELANIPGVNTTVSSIYICRLTRIAATSVEYPYDVYVLFNDSHYVRNDTGSITEYTK